MASIRLSLTLEEAEYLWDLVEGCLGTSESEDFTKCFTKIKSKLRKKLGIVDDTLYTVEVKEKLTVDEGFDAWVEEVKKELEKLGYKGLVYARDLHFDYWGNSTPQEVAKWYSKD